MFLFQDYRPFLSVRLLVKTDVFWHDSFPRRTLTIVPALDSMWLPLKTTLDHDVLTDVTIFAAAEPYHPTSAALSAINAARYSQAQLISTCFSFPSQPLPLE